MRNPHAQDLVQAFLYLLAEARLMPYSSRSTSPRRTADSRIS
jgi:hypothetical protein